MFVVPSNLLTDYRAVVPAGNPGVLRKMWQENYGVKLRILPGSSPITPVSLRRMGRAERARLEGKSRL